MQKLHIKLKQAMKKNKQKEQVKPILRFSCKLQKSNP